MQRGAVSTAHGAHVMFESFRKFLSDVSEGEKRPPHFEHDDYRLAAAALLVHAAAIDGTVSDVEREKLHAVIKRQFGLDEETTDELVAEATEAEHEAIDLYHFTRLIDRSLEEDSRRRVVEMMWEMVYADGRVSEFERNLIWRLRNRLIVAYLFIAVVPIVLILVLLATTAYVVVGQMAVFLVYAELQNRMGTLTFPTNNLVRTPACDPQDRRRRRSVHWQPLGRRKPSLP